MKLHLLTVAIAAALCAAVPIGVRADATTPPELGENDHRVVFVDQNNVPSVTNALATQAQMAAEAAKVELALAKQEANEAGYAAATNLLGQVAASIGAQQTVVFYSVELVSFAAAVIFDETTAKVKITGIETTTDTATKADQLCQKIVLYFAFTDDIQETVPYIEYSETLVDGEGQPIPNSDWGDLAEDFYEAPVRIEGTYTLENVEYRYLYSMNLWVPKSRATGFFKIRIPNDAATGDGSTMDSPGDYNGWTGIITNGNSVLNVLKGRVLVNGTSSGDPLAD